MLVVYVLSFQISQFLKCSSFLVFWLFWFSRFLEFHPLVILFARWFNVNHHWFALVHFFQKAFCPSKNEFVILSLSLYTGRR